MKTDIPSSSDNNQVKHYYRLCIFIIKVIGKKPLPLEKLTLNLKEVRNLDSHLIQHLAYIYILEWPDIDDT